MTEYRIDLNKAKDSDFAEYFFRLTFAFNDLLSVQQLLALVHEDQPEVSSVLRAYLMRMFAAHLAEAANAFVEKIVPGGKPKSPQHPVYEFLQANGKTKEAFDSFEEVVTSQDFSKVIALRSTFFFHYNHLDQGKQTKRAIECLVERSNKCPSGNENLIVRTDSPLTTRFYMGDELMLAAWRMICRAQPCPEEPDTEMQKHVAVIGQALSKFIAYAETAILHWISTYELQQHE